MRCGFCNREIPVERDSETDPEREPCGACAGGCRKVHCPHCGYANPAPTGLLRRWLERDDKKRR